MSEVKLRDGELRLISELMKNSRRSDRELARAIGISQPTVTRIIKKLEKEGIIRDYTMIPDFRKIGYELMAITFMRLKKTLSAEELEKAAIFAQEQMKKPPFAFLMAERGMGAGYDGVAITLHKDYADYLRFVNWIRTVPYLETTIIDSLLISESDIHFLSLTLAVLSRHVLSGKKK